MKYDELIVQWSKDRKIIPNSTTRTQVLKAISEVGELADAILKNDKEDIEDAIGDIYVCWVNALNLADSDSDDDSFLNTVIMILNDISHLVGLPINREITHILERLAFNFTGSDLETCVGKAWEQIKDRKGTLLRNGVFVKES